MSQKMNKETHSKLLQSLMFASSLCYLAIAIVIALGIFTAEKELEQHDLNFLSDELV